LPFFSLVTQDGNTALCLAVAAGHSEVAKLLIEAGAEIDIKNKVRMVTLSSRIRAEGLWRFLQAGKTARSCAKTKELKELLSENSGEMWFCLLCCYGFISFIHIISPILLLITQLQPLVVSVSVSKIRLRRSYRARR
jgi:hypothetical protein